MPDKEKLEQEHEGDFFDEIGDDDFAFVVSTDGNLKSVFVPATDSEVPENITKILEIFGISDIGGQRTLH